jgi:hypothetical protein
MRRSWTGCAAFNHDDIATNARKTSRRQGYLAETGVSLQVWVHAMETPNDRLFVFKPDELRSLNMVTAPAALPVAGPATTKTRS